MNTTTYPVSTLTKHLIGFDDILRKFEPMLSADVSYPPYNIEKLDDDHYVISLAIAGFDKSEITVQVDDSTLIVSGEKSLDEKERVFIHRGIAARNFRRSWRLDNFLEVDSAEVTNGMLEIKLHREIPESMKPRLIKIK